MKYCPYCGASLPDGTLSFCPECGETLPGADTPAPVEKAVKPEKKPAKARKSKKTKPKRSKKEVELLPADDYDGYYNDRLPIDEGHRREGLDKGIIKKVVALVLCLLVVIGACLAILYVI